MRKTRVCNSSDNDDNNKKNNISPVVVKQEVEKPAELFPTKNPAEVVKIAKDISEAVSDIVEKQRLYDKIKDKKYVRCEGWTTMGAMLGLFPQIVEVREEKINDKNKKYVAVCEIRTLDGRLVSRAESECSSLEKNKVGQEDYALRSMAETRAVSKAFRICLSWVMTLAGYEPTPAEEVSEEMLNNKVIEQKVVETPVVEQVNLNVDKSRKITEKQRKLLFVRLREANIPEEVLKKHIEVAYGKTSTADLTMEEFDDLLKEIEQLKQNKQ